MRLLRKSKTPPPCPPLVNPLAAIPLKPANVEMRRDRLGHIHLKLTPALKPLHRKVARWLSYDYSAKLELDEAGSHYYSLVDGQHSLDSIVDEMGAKFGKSRKDMAGQVVEFTKALMMRNMLALKVSGESRQRGQS